MVNDEWRAEPFAIVVSSGVAMLDVVSCCVTVALPNWRTIALGNKLATSTQARGELNRVPVGVGWLLSLNYMPDAARHDG